MNHEQQINELYGIVYNLINELEGFKKNNAQLQDQIIRLNQENQLLHLLRGMSLSTGGVCYLLEKVKQKALPIYETIRQIVANGRVIGADETGVNINGKNYWAWTFQNTMATYIAIHQSRGKKAIDHIMPEGFENNILVTDCWAAYFKDSAAAHQLCTAHLLRELKFFTQKYPELSLIHI